MTRVVHRLKVHPLAGRRFGARVAVLSRTTGKRVTTGQVKCDARIGHRYLRVVVNAFKDGFAACAWRVPGWTRGHHLSARIRVRAGGTYGVRWFWRHVH